MRGKRSKQYRKLMQQYHLHFGFREPYQVLVDAAILQDAARFKMDFTGGLAKALHGQIKPMITQCCIRHLYESEPADSIVVKHAKGFERRRCNHHELEKPLSTFECINSVLDPKGTKHNKFRYVVACQDDKIRAYLRTIPGVPLIYIKRSVMIMEPMPGATESVLDKEERQKFRFGLKGRRNPGQNTERDNNTEENKTELDAADVQQISGLDQSTKANTELELKRKKRKRGPSGPNPLSMKKPKARKEIVFDSDSKLAGAVSAAHLDSEGVSTEKKRKRLRRHKTTQGDNGAPLNATLEEVAASPS